MTWTPLFVNGPLAVLDVSAILDLIDCRLLDRSGEPPEVLYLELLKGSPGFYKVVERPLPASAVVHMYCLDRDTGATAFYRFVGTTGISSQSDIATGRR